MRTLFLTAAFAASFSLASAQDMKDVREKIEKGKYDEAKDKLDKFMADPKNANSAEGYYYKGVIQTHYAQTDSAGTLGYDAAKEAFDAYKKTLEIDPKNVQMALNQNMGLFQLFDMQYNRAIREYNNKNYPSAYGKFINAVELQDYIKSKNFALTSYTPPALDTQLINLTASSAYLAKQEDASVNYFRRLADAKVTGPEYREVYAIIAQHYLKKKDDANASKYLSLGRELYKDDDYWLGLEFGDMGDDKVARIKRYEELSTKYPNNAALATDYAIELFNDAYVYDSKPADYAARVTRFHGAMEKARQLSPASGMLSFLEAQAIYTDIFDMEDSRRNIKTNSTADAAKRRDVNAKIDKRYEDLMAAAQKAFDSYAAQGTMKPQDKVNYRKSADMLIDYYARKKMNDKVTLYTTKKNEIK